MRAVGVQAGATSVCSLPATEVVALAIVPVANVVHAPPIY